MTFNHWVTGSSPVTPTKFNSRLLTAFSFPRNTRLNLAFLVGGAFRKISDFFKKMQFLGHFSLYFLRLIRGSRVIFKDFFTENLAVFELSIRIYRLYANLQSLGPQFESCKVLRHHINRRFQAFLKTYKIQIFGLYVFYVFLYVL